MELKNAIEFLVYSYFNLRIEDGKDPEKVLEKSINRAYLDATQRSAYNTKGDKKDLSKVAKDRGAVEIKSAIKELLKKDLEFEKWHEAICEKLCGADGVYSKVCCAYGDDTFSYGNAQKWVNMSLKYLCILYEIYKQYNKESICEFWNEYERIGNCEKDFHVPVDNYIIEAVWKSKGIKLPFKNAVMNEDVEKRRKYSNEKLISSWSKWSSKYYTDFQKSLRDSGLLEGEASPLDWENKAWIDVAYNRKKEEEEKEAKKKENQN